MNDSLRIGFGYDSHRLVAGRPLILGGVRVPFELGLTGHSDADCLVHALIDALLGAAGEGDIGRHFPDTDPALQGADSVALLERVVGLVGKAGWTLVNADLTLVAERPRIAPHVPAMTARLESVTGEGTVSIKAKTNERMGEIGRGEGMAAFAVCLLRQRGERVRG